jgi:Flp pilus assembly protein TadB
MSWLLLAGALLLLPGAGRTGRHRRTTSTRRRPATVQRIRPATRRRSRPDLPAVAAGATLLACPLAGGQLGLLVAVPAALGVLRGGRWLTSRAAESVDGQAVAFLLDLLAAGLRSGAPTDQAIDAVAKAVREHGGERLCLAMEPFSVVGRLLWLGSEPEQAWVMLAELPGLAPVAAAGRRCADSGARLAGALADTAEQLRHRQLQRALSRAQRAGVWVLLPLGCCFLPAFVCIGIVPVVAGVAGQVLPR